jgi:hypothetical protein
MDKAGDELHMVVRRLTAIANGIAKESREAQ